MHENTCNQLKVLNIPIVIQFIKFLVDTGVHSEQEKVFRCDFKPGSVERSIHH
jgi:hypothetical protein